MSYSGYDIEDAIIMNKASLDRGFGRCVVLRKYGTVLKKHQNRSADLLEPPKIPAGQVRALLRSCASPCKGILVQRCQNPGPQADASVQHKAV